METTVTGLFTDAEVAANARRGLEAGGFAASEITMLNRETRDLRAALGGQPSDAVRGARLGAVVGGVGGAVAAAVLALPPIELFGSTWPIAALFGALVGSLVAGAIGYLVGSATGFEMLEEYEHAIERGGQVIAINTDSAQVSKALEMLRKFGGKARWTSVHRRQRVSQPA